MADALASGASGRKTVRVQISLSPPFDFSKKSGIIKRL